MYTHSCVQMPVEVRRGHWVAWIWSFSQLWAGAENWALREQCLSCCSTIVRRGHDQGNSYTRKPLIRLSEAPGSDVQASACPLIHLVTLLPYLGFSAHSWGFSFSTFTYSSIHKFCSSKMRSQEHSEDLMRRPGERHDEGLCIEKVKRLTKISR